MTPVIKTMQPIPVAGQQGIGEISGGNRCASPAVK